MGILDDLIRVKSNKQEDDLLKLLDEIPIYEKLSADEKLRDLHNSTITRTKCPMLAKFVDGHMYEKILADLAANVYLQIEGTIPPILQTAVVNTVREQKQMEVLQSGIAHVDYRELTEYSHEEMKNNLAAVFVKKQQGATTAALIVRSTDGYTMYHGTYTIRNKSESIQNIYTPVISKGTRGVLTMDSYSVLGNNGYPFARYSTTEVMYNVMIGPEGHLYLMDQDRAVVTCPIPWEERNTLNMVKKDPQAFADTVLVIVESVV